MSSQTWAEWNAWAEAHVRRRIDDFAAEIVNELNTLVDAGVERASK
jgi:hypothetical protein